MPELDGFTFNSETHEYSFEGEPIPSCTEALEIAGLIDFDHISAELLEWKSELGREVHKARHLQDLGKLLSYDPAVGNYLIAWTTFKKESGFIPQLSEHWQGASINGMRYGMRIDALGTIGNRETVLDIKTGEIYPHHAIQLAGYAAGLSHSIYATPLSRFLWRKRAVVQLRSDGSYRLKYFEDRRDFDVFVSALHIATWKKERKLK
jgi:hypothetical protein